MEIWEEDLYELLGVDAEATPEEIKKSYKKLAVSLHPDRFPDDAEKRAEATEKFGRITNAYNILKDEEERAEYDFARRMGFGASGPGAAPETPAAASAPVNAKAAAAAAEADAAVNDLKKSQAENQFGQGQVYHKAKNWQKAIGCYKEAIRLDKTVADYHAYLGLAYLQQGLKSPANSAFAAAYKLDKKNKIVKANYEPPDEPKGAKGKGGKGAKGKGGKGDAKPGLVDQLMALFQALNKPVGGGGKDAGKAKGKKAAPKKAGAKK